MKAEMLWLRLAGGSALLIACSALLGAEPPPEKEPPRKAVIICGREMQLMTAEEVKALGFPWVDVQDDDNAATYYIQGANALHALRSDAKAEQQRQHVQDNVWDDSLKELAAYLESAKPAVDFYRQGAAKRLCQLPYAKTDILAGMLLADLSKARQAARLLAVEARRSEAKGKFKEAVDDYVAMIHVGEHYGNSRTLIDQLVGAACIGIATNGTFSGVYRQGYPKEELKRLLGELDKARESLPDPAYAMRCERAFGLGMIDDIVRRGPQVVEAAAGWAMPAGDIDLSSPLKLRVLRIVLPDRTMKKDMERFYDRTAEAARKPYYMEDARRDFSKECKPWDVFAGMLLPAVGRARSHAEECRARFEMLRVAVALKLYQMETGVYPDDLNWLVKDKFLAALPVDPFSGKPFVYRAKDGQFVLYSVGDNLTDDGGKVEPEAGTGRTLDLGFTSKLSAPKPFRPVEE